jgi:RNA polymerase sigma-70 factor (ECF subfamily)
VEWNDSVTIEDPDWSRATPAPAAADEGLSFEAIYRTHYLDVSRYVIFRAGRADVDEVVAETFSRAFGAWQAGHGPAGPALPWLLTIARRLLTDGWRRSRLIQWLRLAVPSASDQVVESAVAGGGTGEVEFWLWIDALSRVLPARQREVLFLRYQRDLTDDDIGAILGLSSSGVRTLLSRAVAGLRAHPELWQ